MVSVLCNKVGHSFFQWTTLDKLSLKTLANSNRMLEYLKYHITGATTESRTVHKKTIEQLETMNAHKIQSYAEKSVSERVKQASHGQYAATGRMFQLR